MPPTCSQRPRLAEVLVENVGTVSGWLFRWSGTKVSGPKRADEANCIYRAPNRGNARCVIFKKLADFNAFETIVAEGLQRYPCRILCTQ